MAENYKYLQIKPQEDLDNQEAQFCIAERLMPNILCALVAESNSSIKNQSLVYLHIFFSKYCFLPLFHPSCTLYLWVHHSKFSTLLSFRTPFLWFIQGLLSVLGRYVNATNLCTRAVIGFFPFIKRTWKYQLEILEALKKHQSFKVFQFIFGWLQTLPSSVTAYIHSYHGISFISILPSLKNRVPMKSGENIDTLPFNQKCIPDFFDVDSIFAFNNLQYA